MAIRMFDVTPEQQEKGLDGQVAKEDTVQGDGPPETPKERHVPPGPMRLPQHPKQKKLV